MKTPDFYQGTADAMGVALYLYADGAVTNSRREGAPIPLRRLSLIRIGNRPTITVSVTRSDKLRITGA